VEFSIGSNGSGGVITTDNSALVSLYISSLEMKGMTDAYHWSRKNFKRHCLERLSFHSQLSIDLDLGTNSAPEPGKISGSV
jgi:hypothetical protein